MARLASHGLDVDYPPTTVIWKTLLVAEQNFRRLDAPELLPEVAESVVYVNGERAKRDNTEAAA